MTSCVMMPHLVKHMWTYNYKYVYFSCHLIQVVDLSLLELMILLLLLSLSFNG